MLSIFCFKLGLDSPTASVDPTPNPDSPTAIRNTSLSDSVEEEKIQLEPSDAEMEREKLLAKGEQVQLVLFVSHTHYCVLFLHSYMTK